MDRHFRAIERGIALQVIQESADIAHRVFAQERPVVQADEALAEPGRAADVGIEHRDAQLVDQVIGAPAERWHGLAFRAAVDVDDQRALAGEFGGIGAIEKAGDRLAVKTLHLDQLRLGIARGVQPAGFAFRPAGYGQAFGIDGKGIGRHPCGGQRQADPAPRRNPQSADHALGQARNRAHRASHRIEQLQPRDPRFVDDIGDEAAIGGNLEVLHVPARIGRACGELASLAVDRPQPLEVRTGVAGGPQRAVGRELRAALGNRLLVIAQRGQLARCQIEQIEIALGHRDIVGHHRRRIIGRKAGDRPAAAADLRHHPGAGGIARIDDVEIGVGAVAAGRAIGQQFAVVAERPHFIAALAIGQQRQAAVLQRVELPELAAAAILADHQRLVIGGIASVQRLGLKADLPPRHAGAGDRMQLRYIAEPGGDQHRAVIRVPAHEAGGAELHIGPRGIDHALRDRRNAIGNQRGRLGGNRRGRGVLCE